MAQGTDETEFDQVLVDHAVRCWEAEIENASRLSSRANFVLTAIGALFALGLYRIDWFRGDHDQSRISSIAAIRAIKALLGLALLSVGWSFVQNIGRRGKRAENIPHSSNLLALPESIITQGAPVGGEARRLVFIRVYRAFLDLQGRNATRKKAQDRAQLYLVLGFILIGAALLTYTFASDPPLARSVETSNAKTISTIAPAPAATHQ